MTANLRANFFDDTLDELLVHLLRWRLTDSQDEMKKARSSLFERALAVRKSVAMFE
jgi:hypothetical protein